MVERAESSRRRVPPPPPPVTAKSDVKNDAADDPMIGAVLDDTYRIRRRLGAGGMAVVYEAVEVSIERPVAIKILNEHFRSLAEHRVRFRNEAKIAARLEHPNLVRIYRCEVDSEGMPYIVMELLKGHDLQAELKRTERIDWRRAAMLVIQLCNALDAAHRRGIIHRDVKPANCFLSTAHVDSDDASDNETLKLLDLGIAKLSGDLASFETTIPHTQKGMVFGTWSYMAPEQLSQQPVFQTDLYAVGAVLYRMITGRHALKREGLSDVQFSMKIFREAPRPPCELAPEIPTQLDELILKALAKSPTERPQTAIDFRDALQRCLDDDAEERRIGQKRPPLRALYYAAAGFASISAVAAFALLYSVSGSARGAGKTMTSEMQVVAATTDEGGHESAASRRADGPDDLGERGDETDPTPLEDELTLLETSGASEHGHATESADRPDRQSPDDSRDGGDNGGSDDSTDPTDQPDLTEEEPGRHDKRKISRHLKDLKSALEKCHSDPFGRALKIEFAFNAQVDGNNATLTEAKVTKLAYDDKKLSLASNASIVNCLEGVLVRTSVVGVEVGGRFSRLRVVLK